MAKAAVPIRRIAACKRGCFILGLILPAVVATQAAERYGDILVAPQTTVSGETRHGYVEYRVWVANDSASRAHTVTLDFPDGSPAYGDCVQSITRSARLGPNSSATLILWQPPLPAASGGIAVYVDGKKEGSVGLPGFRRHLPVFSGQGNQGARTYLLSRSLDSDDVKNLFTEVFGAPWSPAKATGRPDAGPMELAWQPGDTNAPTEWLELDYEPAMLVHQVNIHETQAPGSVTEVLLYDTNGVHVATVGTAGGTTRQRGIMTEYNFPLTKQAIGRVRLYVRNRGPAYPPTSIDAVELVGPARRSWAVGARASSHATSGPGTRGMSSSMARRYGLTTGMVSGQGEPSQNLVRSELEMSQWSDHWLAYTPYDVVLMTARDYAAVSEPARMALWRYVECGGCLVVLGKIEIPAPWQKRTAGQDRGSERVPVGFGQCLVFDVADVKQLTKEQGQSIADAARISGWPWSMPNPSSTSAANEQFPVIANVKIPFRSMVLILLVFVILIGPANLVFLSRCRRKIWSLWTIPAISFVTCGLVFSYSFLSEGITPHVRLEGLTLLDQVNHRATTLGLMAFYCPLTPSGGLRFGYDTELSPVLDQDYRRSGRAREVEWTRSQHFNKGWLVSRVPAYFRLRKSEVRRERIQFEKDRGGQWAAVNGLGAPIQSLQITDFSGQLYGATNVAAGQRVLLAPLPQPPVLQTNASLLSDLYRLSSWSPVEPLWQKLQTNVLPRGTYLALLSSTPFLEEALAGKALTRRRSAVLGILNPTETSP